MLNVNKLSKKRKENKRERLLTIEQMLRLIARRHGKKGLYKLDYNLINIYIA
jgi:hypothetical protein